LWSEAEVEALAAEALAVEALAAEALTGAEAVVSGNQQLL
jgi:hypothetical protein